MIIEKMEKIDIGETKDSKPCNHSNEMSDIMDFLYFVTLLN